MGQTKISNRQIAGGLDGWISAEETWTYASADAPTFVITVPSGAVSKYSAGMRIKLTQTTVKYFIITAVSDTTLTVYGGTDYTLANAAISANYYSMVKSPVGFPMSPDKWTEIATSTSSASQASPTQNAWYNLDTHTLSVPIGSWYFSYLVVFGAAQNSTTVVSTSCTLSTANNSESDSTLTSYAAYIGASGNITIREQASREKILSVASKTSYYLNVTTANSSAASINTYSAIVPGKIYATCAYL